MMVSTNSLTSSMAEAPLVKQLDMLRRVVLMVEPRTGLVRIKDRHSYHWVLLPHEIRWIQ